LRRIRTCPANFALFRENSCSSAWILLIADLDGFDHPELKETNVSANNNFAATRKSLNPKEWQARALAANMARLRAESSPPTYGGEYCGGSCSDR